MPWKVEQVLAHAFVREPRRLLREYQFFVGEIPVAITIGLYELIGSKQIEFDQSHFIRTPDQIAPDTTIVRAWDSEGDALEAAISPFVEDYGAAVAEGYKPRESWLVRNEDF